mmetsp:Transcript_36176/g.111468  ORF Transcript_36176/g.111468 Transcript_36176/m.111468 type:complete len:235 (+) Transcript_36176:180-884(+)
MCSVKKTLRGRSPNGSWKSDRLGCATHSLGASSRCSTSMETLRPTTCSNASTASQLPSLPRTAAHQSTTRDLRRGMAAPWLPRATRIGSGPDERAITSHRACNIDPTNPASTSRTRLAFAATTARQSSPLFFMAGQNVNGNASEALSEWLPRQDGTVGCIALINAGVASVDRLRARRCETTRIRRGATHSASENSCSSLNVRTRLAPPSVDFATRSLLIGGKRPPKRTTTLGCD